MSATERLNGADVSNGYVVETRDLVREYPVGTGVVRAVDGISLAIEPGQLVAVRGRSGSG